MAHQRRKKGFAPHPHRRGIGDAAALGAEDKSFPLTALQAIARLPGVRLIALQKHAAFEQLDALLRDFLRHGHRASGGGVPNGIALIYVLEWRWFLDRLFRQQSPGAWGPVFNSTEAVLRTPA